MSDNLLMKVHVDTVIKLKCEIAGYKRALKIANEFLAKNPDGRITHRIVAVPFTEQELNDSDE
jgi:hypothetical protein